jgi:A/G-specific adenine glycosylase
VLSGLTETRTAVLRWAIDNHRELPWRSTRDPWAVLVSELMLQQTQAARVVPKYLAFLERFSTPEACSSAPLGDVLRSWTGLGYNRRAVNLHRCATEIVERHGGRVPDGLEALRALPGIGPYTARAVMAFAFERDVGIVDTNVARVLARWHGRRLTAREVQAAADELVPRGDSWVWNQGMLDLGATVCTKRAPNCAECPTHQGCAWYQVGGIPPDPADGSAGVSGRQSTFEGSDRQGRGRLVAVLSERGRVPRERLAEVAGWPRDTDRASRVAATLVHDGLARWGRDGSLRLPG